MDYLKYYLNILIWCDLNMTIRANNHIDTWRLVENQ